MAAAAKAGSLYHSIDRTRSLHYTHMAATAGVADAQYAWGCILYDAHDTHDAYTWIRAAAHQHHAEACYMLYTYLMHGDGCLQNTRDAQKWLRRAAKAGHQQAQEVLIQSGCSTPTSAHLSTPSSHLSTPTSTSSRLSSAYHSPGNTPPTRRNDKLASHTSTCTSHDDTPPRSHTPTPVTPSQRSSVSHDMTMESDVEEEDADQDEMICPMFHTE